MTPSYNPVVFKV